MEKTAEEKIFSVELKSRANLKNIALNDGGGGENILIEGTIGGLRNAQFVEGLVLEVVGDKGVLRINLTPNEIRTKNNEKGA